MPERCGLIPIEDAINEICTQLKNNSFSAFCGAGVTLDATNSRWINIFNDKTKKYYDYKFSDDIYFLADLEKRYHNKEKFYYDIKNKLKSTSLGGRSEYINTLVKLNLNQIWTTNFDNIIENTIKFQHKIKPEVISSSDDLLTANLSNKYIVYKLNGSINNKRTLILTKTDYYEYFKKQRLMFEILKRQLVLDSFLFMGYSFKDELVLNALREIKEVLPNKGKTHYRFKTKPKLETNIIKAEGKYAAEDKLKSNNEYLDYEIRYFYENYNIKTILIDDHVQEKVFLDNLYKKFCSNNVFISGSYRNIDNSSRVFIEKLVDKLVYNLYTNGFSIYSGNGRGLGEIVLARADKYSNLNKSSKFVNRPYIFFGDTSNVKAAKNKKIIKDCSTMIIIAGQDNSGITSKNVNKQFNQFVQMNKKESYLVVPIAQTGYAAESIFKSKKFKKDLSYIENKEKFESLKKLSDDNYEEIAKLTADMISNKFKKI